MARPYYNYILQSFTHFVLMSIQLLYVLEETEINESIVYIEIDEMASS